MELLFDSVYTIPLALLTVAASLIYWYCTNTFNYWKDKGVPYAPPTPLFGNVKEALLGQRNYHYVHQDLYNHFKGERFAGIYHAKKPALFLRDPELIKLVLVKDFQHFHDRDIPIINLEKNPLQQHLFLLAGHKWRVLRNKLSPTFTSGKIKGMFHIMAESSGKLLSFLKEAADREEVIEMKEVLAKFSTDVIGSCAFGLQLNALDDPNSEFRRMGRSIFEPKTATRFARFLFELLPQLTKWINVDTSQDKLTEFFMRVVKETAAFRIKNNVVRNDFFQLLINLRQKGNVEYDENDEQEKHEIFEKSKDALDFELDDGLMAAQVFVFFLAGFETSSTTMSFALHELAVNPDIQKKLRDEIDASLEETGGKFTYESIINMKYLDKVVSETLRMYPPVLYLRREATLPFRIPGSEVTVDKGTSVVIPVYALQHDPDYFPDPLRFDPERFSEENKAKRHHYVYLPFGEGPRNCIGMRFGLLQTKLGLVTLLSKYEFHVSERTPIPLQLSPSSVVLASTTGTVVRITHRS
ncbi:hypothetical protein R5R35_010842 [Gryllus longicercus]|uniref:Cytochrome P450 n=1 Tax=Gryllus longicercus TaxID=2509291 RepID=A0AAN9VW92_9ORTH